MKNADINIKNNEGLKPKDLATDQAVKKLMQGIFFLCLFFIYNSMNIAIRFFDFLFNFIYMFININKNKTHKCCFLQLQKELRITIYRKSSLRR